MVFERQERGCRSEGRGEEGIGCGRRKGDKWKRDRRGKERRVEGLER